MIFGILEREGASRDFQDPSPGLPPRSGTIQRGAEGIVLQFDGEIYNRTELQSWLGIQEDLPLNDLLTEGYRRKGEALFDRIDGPFSLAFWDGPSDRLLLCRDRFGLRPLYYFLREGKEIVFASEVRDLLRCPWVPRRPNLSALQEYMVFGHVAGARGFYEGILELEPGHLLEVQGERLTPTKREALPILLSPDDRSGMEELTEVLSARLVDALRRQLQACRGGPPVVFLSGGVDSSVIVGLLRRRILHEEDPILTYTVTLPGYPQDEGPWAAKVNELFHCEPYELPFGPEVMADSWAPLISSFCEPLTSTNTLSWFLLAQTAAGNGHVHVFSGEGADGLLSGGLYPWEVEEVRSGRRGEEEGILFCQSHVLNPPEIVGKVMEGEWNTEERRRIWQTARRRHRHLPVEYAQIAYQVRTTGNRLLSRAERTAIAHGVSLLLPYVQRDWVRTVFSIPYELMNPKGQKKEPLKRLAAGLMGEDLALRRKVGFPFPIRGWLRDRKAPRLGEYVDLLLERRTLERGIYRKEAFRREVERRMAGEVKPMDWLLWSAINVELWFRLCLEDQENRGEEVVFS